MQAMNIERNEKKSMTDFDTVDFFTDESLVADPYGYFDHLRSKCPVASATPFDVMAVTGYEEALAVYKNNVDFSSCNSLAGPFSGLPFGPDGADDVTDLIEEHRHVAPMAEQYAYDLKRLGGFETMTASDGKQALEIEFLIGAPKSAPGPKTCLHP